MFQFLGLRLAALGISVTGKVNKIPLVVHYEMVYEQGLSRHRGGHSQLGLSGEHIYKTRFTDIGTADERILGFTICRAFRYVGVAYDKACRFYIFILHYAL
jgi:hypothetical protein